MADNYNPDLLSYELTVNGRMINLHLYNYGGDTSLTCKIRSRDGYYYEYNLIALLTIGQMFRYHGLDGGLIDRHGEIVIPDDGCGRIPLADDQGGLNETNPLPRSNELSVPAGIDGVRVATLAGYLRELFDLEADR